MDEKPRKTVRNSVESDNDPRVTLEFNLSDNQQTNEFDVTEF